MVSDSGPRFSYVDEILWLSNKKCSMVELHQISGVSSNRMIVEEFQ